MMDLFSQLDTPMETPVVRELPPLPVHAPAAPPKPQPVAMERVEAWLRAIATVKADRGFCTSAAQLPRQSSDGFRPPLVPMLDSDSSLTRHWPEIAEALTLLQHEDPQEMLARRPETRFPITRCKVELDQDLHDRFTSLGVSLLTITGEETFTVINFGDFTV
jgi:hypothetical protein